MPEMSESLKSLKMSQNFSRWTRIQVISLQLVIPPSQSGIDQSDNILGINLGPQRSIEHGLEWNVLDTALMSPNGVKLDEKINPSISY